PPLVGGGRGRGPAPAGAYGPQLRRRPVLYRAAARKLPPPNPRPQGAGESTEFAGGTGGHSPLDMGCIARFLARSSLPLEGRVRVGVRRTQTPAGHGVLRSISDEPYCAAAATPAAAGRIRSRARRIGSSRRIAASTASGTWAGKWLPRISRTFLIALSTMSVRPCSTHSFGLVRSPTAG